MKLWPATITILLLQATIVSNVLGSGGSSERIEEVSHPLEQIEDVSDSHEQILEDIGDPLPPLEELKEKTLIYNTDLMFKRQEIEAVKAEGSFLSNIRLTSSYNFELNRSFAGVVASVPLDFFRSRRKYLEFKRLGLEKKEEEVLEQLEGFYYQYMTLVKQLEPSRAALSQAKLRRDLAREEFEHDRIERDELLEAEKRYQEADFALYKLIQDIKLTKKRICNLVGITPL